MPFPTHRAAGMESGRLVDVHLSVTNCDIRRDERWGLEAGRFLRNDGCGTIAETDETPQYRLRVRISVLAEGVSETPRIQRCCEVRNKGIRKTGSLGLNSSFPAFLIPDFHFRRARRELFLRFLCGLCPPLKPSFRPDLPVQYLTELFEIGLAQKEIGHQSGAGRNRVLVKVRDACCA